MASFRQDISADAARILESITDAFLALDTEWRFTYVNDQADRLMSLGREQVMGGNFWEVFPHLVGTEFDRHYHRAMAGQVPVSFETFYPTLDAWLEVRAFPSPEGLSVFFRDVSERKALEAERERLLAQTETLLARTERLLAQARGRAEREALLNRIGAAFRTSSDALAVQETAVRLLGEALSADRCYFALYDLEGGTVRISRDWHREGLPPVRGTYPFANTAEMFQELHGGSPTSVIPDAHASALSAQTLANMESLPIRSRVSVALSDAEGLIGTLTAAMSEGPREWTTEEVALVEAVATQMRTAVEAARVAERERNIAAQLQAALQPDLPATVPGLALAKHYAAALAEAGVGGDFYDVYVVEEGCTALVVGDLAGKGLAAAAQVSTVRNMLRAFLYSRRTVGEAVMELNRVLAENRLLTGFATLFVGAYDSHTGILNYANCGQEPALVLRAATGRVEELRPTGPVLGMAGDAAFEDGATALGPGDALAVFTDGLTEVGPSRSEMLGVEGVAALLADPAMRGEAQDAGRRAEALTLHLIAGVDRFARSGVRDDVCLLVGVVQP